MRLGDGARLAVTVLTVAPLRGPAEVDRATAATAMSLAPAVGLLLGAVQAGLGTLPTPPLLGGVLVVAAGALLTRGLHLDGLADTVDGLGSYRDRDQALAIMKQPAVGPFGVVALILTVLAQVVGAATLLARGWPAAGAGIVAAVVGGRVAIAVACRRGVPAARPDGLGALVAGTVSPTVVAGWVLVAATVAVPAVPGRYWQGPVAVLVGVIVAAFLVRHATRRFGGVTGDILGAACEVATTVIYIVASM